MAGFHPTLLTADGVHDLAQHAPFDRIIVTCSVPAVPWKWAEQLTPGGSILVDLKLAASAGNLVHLHRAGAAPLWSAVEWAYAQWIDAGRPSWDRLGLTVTANGAHQVWLDRPDSEHRWQLR